MQKARVTYRLIVLIVVFFMGLILSLPTFFGFNYASKINLGLDLQGGLHMVLGVDTNEAVNSKVKSISSSLNYAFNKEEILSSGVKSKDGFITFELDDKDDVSKIDKLLKDYKGLVIDKNNLSYRLYLSDSEIVATQKFAVEQAIETIRNRLDQFGLAEPTVARQGEDQILVELPGIKTEAEEQRAKDLIAKSAHLELMVVDDVRQNRVDNMSEEEAAKYGDVIYSGKDGGKYLLKEMAIIDGSMLVDAKVGFDQQTNGAVISFELNAQGAKIFGDFTGKSIGKRLAIVLDKKVYSAPRINSRITSNGQITGNFTPQEAHDLAIALKSGALLAPVKMLEKRSVGPSLGSDSIKQSGTALVGVFLMIVVFMFVYYKISGLFANIALITNVFFLISIMAMLGATLTLPGMAGIILTVGMAVDANIIINERIREMLRDGASIKASIEDGYKNAMSAIVDSNLTTLITSAALYAYGTGAIKGFAVTMSIGIVASMITAIICTHGLFDFFLSRIEKSKNINLWFGYKIDNK